MKLKKIEWRNIKSFGNVCFSMDFNNKGGLWHILGRNGSGKSSLVDLPKILYYGKLDKFKKDDISNRLNKHGWISGEIEINPTTMVTIERNFSPSDLKIYKYDKGDFPREENEIGKAGIKNYQDYIDNEITGLPYHIFSNIISLSVNDFKSFVSMSPGDKRIIIDKLFAMEVINEMNKLVKEELRKLKTDLYALDGEIKTLQSSIKNASTELENAKKSAAEDNTVKEQNISKILIELKPKLEEAIQKLEKFKTKEVEIKKSADTFVKQKTELTAELKQIKKKVQIYNQEKCPTCETPFNDKRFELIKGELTSEFNRKGKELRELLNKDTTYSDALEKVRKGINTINEFIIKYRTEIANNEVKLTELKLEKPTEFQSIENIISKNTEEIKSKEKNKKYIGNEFKYVSILEKLYSEDGVKKKVLNSYLPTLNSEIEYTLSELHFPYRLRFNNDFEPIMEHLGIDINVETLSTGEKKRVDLAVLISIIRMLKRKYPALNIFMLDEVLSSIDGDGIYDIIGLLQKTAKDLSMNIFIINHAPLPVEYFSYKIEINKNDGFSDMTIENLG